MKLNKLILAVSLTGLTAAPAFASDWFIGGSVGSQTNNFTESHTVNKEPRVGEGNSNWSNDSSQTDAVYSFRAGKYFGEAKNQRAYMTYSYNGGQASGLGNADYSQENLMLSYDYLVPLGESNINWFVGASAGYAKNNIKASHLGGSDDFVYGGQTGFQLNATDNIDVEIGYRYLKQDYKKGSDFDNGATTLGVSMDDSHQVYLGVDYRF